MAYNWKARLLAGAVFLSSLGVYFQYRKKKSAEEKELFSEQVLAESEKYPSTTHFIYEIQKNSHLNFHNADTLEMITRNVKKIFAKKEKYSEDEALEMLTAIDNEIKNLGFRYKYQKFDCDDISYIYLFIGEKFNLSLHGVFAPGHMFVRYDSDGRHNPENPADSVNIGDFNWETIEAKVYSDEHYKKILNIHEKSIKNLAYLDNLTKKELIASAYENCGISFYERGLYGQALENYSKSILLAENNSSAYLNRGSAFAVKWEYNLALKDYNKSIELDPNNISAYLMRAEIFAITGQHDLAKKDYEKAREIYIGYLENLVSAE